MSVGKLQLSQTSLVVLRVKPADDTRQCCHYTSLPDTLWPTRFGNGIHRRAFSDRGWGVTAVVTCGAGRQFAGQQVGDALKVVVARVAEVRGAKTEKYGHRTAIPAFVL